MANVAANAPKANRRRARNLDFSAPTVPMSCIRSIEQFLSCTQWDLHLQHAPDIRPTHPVPRAHTRRSQSPPRSAINARNAEAPPSAAPLPRRPARPTTHGIWARPEPSYSKILSIGMRPVPSHWSGNPDGRPECGKPHTPEISWRIESITSSEHPCAFAHPGDRGPALGQQIYTAHSGCCTVRSLQE